MKKCLLHICCAPCSIYPIKKLFEKFFFIVGYFYRDNIHPFSECIKRENALIKYAEQSDFKLIIDKKYDIEGFIRKMVFRESDRCMICYYERLKAASMIAKKGKFDCFTTTLLYSRFQKHEMIKSIGEAAGKTSGVPFYYEDFREGWREGIDESKRLGMCRQEYCGCIYSEKERYFNKRKK